MADEKSKEAYGNGHKYMHTSNPDDDNEEDNAPAECGVGSFKPAALRMCASISVFTGVYSFSGLLTSTLSSYVNSQVTTLERHFGFNSAQTGLIMAANDVGFLVMVLFVSYIAAKVHIPRSLALVTILFGISGIMCAMPHFMFGAPSPSGGNVRGGDVSNMTSPRSFRSFSGQICDGVNDTSSECNVDVTNNGLSKMADKEDPDNRARANAGVALAVIVAGMVLQGIAKTPRYSFVTSYVDDNVDKVKTGFIMGIITAVAIMGPAVAFALGGAFTRIYVTLEETDMHFRHPKWIGAWWLGYVTFGAAAIVFAVPLFFFPRRIKGGKRVKKPASVAQKVNVIKTVSTFLTGFMAAMVRLWTNPVYIFVVLSSCFLLFSVAGGQSFTPKYIENQFSFPAWKANMAMAGMMLGTACLGTFLGGYITKRFKMGPMVSLKFVMAMQMLSVIFTGLMMAFSCDQPYLYNSPGPRASADTSLGGCLDNCACDNDDYFPVCGDDGRSFFSPCHAGCLDIVGKSYVNCSCIEGGTAEAGMCDYGCPMFYPFMICMCCSALFGTFSIIPKLIIYIRATEARDKPLALGFSSFMSSITGWMLGPICFGKLIDGICIQWEHGCTGSGSCRLYDNENFRWKLLGYQTAFRFMGFVCVVIALIIAKVTNKFDKVKDVPKDLELEVSLINGQKGDNHTIVKPV
ncbi:solute carrier organic anion transporter family member 2A1-like isoform X1 [Littorina saxatilis]|uniref:Solute carrier organic anion transporter family member n=1 Tax=Littorina saxatilis TaxID=31220 RepID=A0AAN9BJC1_9CAEN